MGSTRLSSDLSSIPTAHLISLTTSLTKCLKIEDVCGCDLVGIMDSLKCEKMTIRNQDLGSDETRAMLQAMESRVVDLKDNVTLDTTFLSLQSYSDQDKSKIATLLINKMDLKNRLSGSAFEYGSRARLYDFTWAAKLAHQGLLGSVEKLNLCHYSLWSDRDLTTVPSHHLISLTSSVTETFIIHRVRGCDLVGIMDSLKCEEIHIRNQTLTCEETRALIRALESRVKELVVGENVSIDNSALAEFGGKLGRRFIQWIKIEEKLKDCDSLPDITIAASLAHHGFLGSVSYLNLHDVDLSSVPAEHLASLASCVYQGISFERVISNMVSFLDGLKKCERLSISTLGREETQALVRAMETSVYKVCLEGDNGVDIEDLILYSGGGYCQEISCSRNQEFSSKSEDALRSWAKTKNWKVTSDGSHIHLNDNKLFIL